jgi:hypothetical protein
MNKFNKLYESLLNENKSKNLKDSEIIDITNETIDQIRNNPDHWSAEKGDEDQLETALKLLSHTNELSKTANDGMYLLSILLRRRVKIQKKKYIDANFVKVVHKNFKKIRKSKKGKV